MIEWPDSRGILICVIICWSMANSEQACTTRSQTGNTTPTENTWGIRTISSFIFRGDKMAVVFACQSALRKDADRDYCFDHWSDSSSHEPMLTWRASARTTCHQRTDSSFWRFTSKIIASSRVGRRLKHAATAMVNRHRSEQQCKLCAGVCRPFIMQFSCYIITQTGLFGCRDRMPPPAQCNTMKTRLRYHVRLASWRLNKSTSYRRPHSPTAIYFGYTLRKLNYCVVLSTLEDDWSQNTGIN